jgi:hypothetical protein
MRNERRKQKSLRETLAEAARKIADLANPGAQESAVVLQTDLPTGEEVGDGCDRLFVATRARTDRQDEITQ